MIENMINALFRCRHKRLTRPITPVHRPGTPAYSYVACLDCGRQFEYDTKELRIGSLMPVPRAAYRPLSNPFQVQ